MFLFLAAFILVISRSVTVSATRMCAEHRASVAYAEIGMQRGSCKCLRASGPYLEPPSCLLGIVRRALSECTEWAFNGILGRQDVHLIRSL